MDKLVAMSFVWSLTSGQALILIFCALQFCGELQMADYREELGLDEKFLQEVKKKKEKRKKKNKGSQGADDRPVQRKRPPPEVVVFERPQKKKKESEKVGWGFNPMT